MTAQELLAEIDSLILRMDGSTDMEVKKAFAVLSTMRYLLDNGSVGVLSETVTILLERMQTEFLEIENGARHAS